MNPNPVPVQLAALAFMAVCAVAAWDFLQFNSTFATLFAFFALLAGLADLSFIITTYAQRLHSLSMHERNFRRASQPVGVLAVVLVGVLRLTDAHATAKALAVLALDPAANWPIALGLGGLAVWGVAQIVAGVRRCAGARDGLLAMRAVFKLAAGAAITFWLWRRVPVAVSSWADLARVCPLLAGVWCVAVGSVRFLLLTVGGGSAGAIVRKQLKQRNAPLRPAKRPWWRLSW
ncbi:MAG: hypothetical protein AB7P20_06255 [Rhizobiaceae bacterium]